MRLLLGVGVELVVRTVVRAVDPRVRPIVVRTIWPTIVPVGPIVARRTPIVVPPRGVSTPVVMTTPIVAAAVVMGAPVVAVPTRRRMPFRRPHDAMAVP